MFARCTMIQGDPDTADQAIQLLQEQVVPFSRQQPGAKGVLAFVDRETGKMIAFTLWDSEESRAASVEAADRLRKETSQQLDASVLSVENYELVMDER